MPSVAGACSITVTPVSFGLYDVFEPAPLDSIGTVTLSCPGDTPAVRVSFAGAPNDRALVNGADTLRYTLYLDAARTRVWGDGTAGSDVLVTAASTTPQTFTVFGRIAPRQNVRAGPYADTITVIIDF